MTKNRGFVPDFLQQSIDFRSYRLSPPAALAYELKQTALIAPRIAQMPS